MAYFLQEFAVRSGLYLQAEIGTAIYTEGITKLDRQTLVSFWRAIAVSHFGKSQTKASNIRDPLYIYLHRAIATSISPRTSSREKVNQSDLFFLYCLLLGRTCDLAKSLAEYFKSAHHRQARGQLYDGAFVTVLGRSLGIFPEADPQLSAPIPSTALAVSNARSMQIYREFPGGVGPRLRSPGSRAPYVPVALPALGISRFF